MKSSNRKPIDISKAKAAPPNKSAQRSARANSTSDAGRQKPGAAAASSPKSAQRSDRANKTPDPGPRNPDPGPKLLLTGIQRQFLHLLRQGASIDTACDLLNKTRAAYDKWLLRTENFAAAVHLAREEHRAFIASGFHDAEAFARSLLDRVQRDEALPVRYRMRASFKILNRRGVSDWLPESIPLDEPLSPEDRDRILDLFDYPIDRHGPYEVIVHPAPSDDPPSDDPRSGDPASSEQQSHDQPTGFATEPTESFQSEGEQQSDLASTSEERSNLAPESAPSEQRNDLANSAPEAGRREQEAGSSCPTPAAAAAPETASSNVRSHTDNVHPETAVSAPPNSTQNQQHPSTIGTAAKMHFHTDIETTRSDLDQTHPDPALFPSLPEAQRSDRADTPSEQRSDLANTAPGPGSRTP